VPAPSTTADGTSRLSDKSPLTASSQTTAPLASRSSGNIPTADEIKVTHATNHFPIAHLPDHSKLATAAAVAVPRTQKTDRLNGNSCFGSIHSQLRGKSCGKGTWLHFTKMRFRPYLSAQSQLYSGFQKTAIIPGLSGDLATARNISTIFLTSTSNIVTLCTRDAIVRRFNAPSRSRVFRSVWCTGGQHSPCL
jgi:hypothetical protein